MESSEAAKDKEVEQGQQKQSETEENVAGADNNEAANQEVEDVQARDRG